MSLSNCARGLVIVWGALAAAATLPAAEFKVEQVKEAPPGLSAEVAAALSETAWRVSGAEGVVCDVWLVKEAALKPKFKPTLRVKYPFQSGTLVGAIRFPENSKPSDFRGQELKPAIYTLRYGLQPDDGNHLGTSDIRDFLVGCPPADDTSTKRVEDLKKLFKLSAGAAGTTHPAIFLLLPPAEKPPATTSVRHDEEKNHVILQVSVPGTDGAESAAVGVSLVVLGKTDA
jgi:hypothetical protein